VDIKFVFNKAIYVRSQFVYMACVTKSRTMPKEDMGTTKSARGLSSVIYQL